MQNFNYNNYGSYTYYTLPPEYEKQMLKKEVAHAASMAGLIALTALLTASVVAVIFEFVSLFLRASSALSLGGSYEEAINSLYDMLSGANSLDLYFLQGIGSLAGFGLIGLIFAKRMKLNFNKIFCFSKVKISVILPMILGGFAVCMLANYSVTYLMQNFEFFGIVNREGISLTGHNLTQNIMYYVVVSVLPGVCEELLFRGVILGSLRKYGGPFAIIGSSLLFAIMHGNIIQIPFAFVVGVVLGFMTVKTNSMLPAIILHMLNNAFVVSSDIFMQSYGEDMYEIVFTIIIAAAIVIGLVAIAFLAKSSKGTFFVMRTPNSAKNTIATNNLGGQPTATQPQFAVQPLQPYGTNVALTLKEKMRAFFLNPGVIVFLIFCLITVIASSQWQKPWWI
ncbi:MAG: CPBP family intramembrane metalloprotease [Oscillospiraceae bacterium]|nr:CPBP family intramembrane metalloprotease [Oscillospiraceae bacterium]